MKTSIQLTMINRSNWKCVKGYLAQREEIDQVSVGTLKLDASLLRHLLEWADDVSFREAPMIRPSRESKTFRPLQSG